MQHGIYDSLLLILMEIPSYDKPMDAKIANLNLKDGRKLLEGKANAKQLIKKDYHDTTKMSLIL